MFRYGDASLASPVNRTVSLLPVRKAVLTPYQRKCYARMYHLRLAEEKRFTYKSAYLYEQIRQMHELQNAESVVETGVDVMTESVETGLQNDDIRECGETVRLPSDKADYMRMSVAEKVRCYPFDDKETYTAFEMVRTYFEKIGMDTSFDSVYEETKLLLDYYEKQMVEEFIQEKTEQIIGVMKLLGLDVGNLAEYSTDVLSKVFNLGDMGYFAGIKLFNKVIDRLGVDMDQQKRYEVFDHIYEGGMREKKGERDRNSR